MSDERSYDIPHILEQMRADYWRNLESAEQVESDTRSDYLAIVLGGQLFALPAAACREVLKLPRIVRVPRLPAHLCGIINLRGEIVAVTDLRPLLQLPVGPPAGGERLVIVAVGDFRTALLAERVAGMRTLASRDLEPLAEGGGTAGELFSGKVETPQGVMLLVDVQRLLARHDLVVDRKQVADSSGTEPVAPTSARTRTATNEETFS